MRISQRTGEIIIWIIVIAVSIYLYSTGNGAGGRDIDYEESVIESVD